MNAILKQISLIGIVPVIAIDDVEKAVPLARALVAGGLPVAEVTFRTAQAAEAIARIAQEVPEMLVGAGTVLTPEQVDLALASGAKFMVSPGLNPRVARHCIDKGVPIVPGCTSPSDMEAAMELGLDVVKFFPAEQAGGLAFLKAVAAPYGGLHFMPTGGVSAKNLNDYLAFEKIVACGGSWMVKGDLIAAGEFDTITALTRAAVQTMLGMELRHVGINCPDEAEAERSAKTFAALLFMPYLPGNTSVFVGSAVECMKKPGMGKSGHLAIAVNSVDRAVYHLGLQGFRFDEASRKTDEKGRGKFIYLADEIGGFAVHLVQK